MGNDKLWWQTEIIYQIYPRSFNDLIDPEAIMLERNYGCYIKSSIPVMVQFSRMNTGSKANAELAAMAFPIDI